MQGQTHGTQSVGHSNYNPYANITAGRVTDISQEQLANAAIIVSVGRSMGLSTRDIQIGLITAMTESNLINVNYGDRDSLGLFQQRPSQGWGTPEQVTNPQYAAGKFFKALIGLGDRRFGMGMGEAAQAVQRSAFPDRYAEHIKGMRAMWPAVQRASGMNPQSIDGGSYTDDQDRSWEDSPYVGNVTTAAEYAAGETGQPATLAGPGLFSGDGATSYGTGGALTEIVTPEPVTPTVHQMLGAWGMGNPAVQQPEPYEVPVAGGDPFVDGAMPIISPATNASVLQPIQEETGDFAKGVDGWRKAVISAARIALGTPYTWGGNSLQGGVDCSGLVQQAFAKAGLTMPRVSYQQAGRGARVGLDALRPGDLVAWDNSSRNNGADHIAIYIGGGQIIEAARPGTAVRIRSVSPDEGAWGVHLNF
jgi:hypothetical protein